MSRLKKDKEKEQWIKDREDICNRCEFNTKNIKKLSFEQKIYNFFSNALTLITTGQFNEDDSACSICKCTLLYKIPEPTEKCDKNKWN